MEAMKAFISYFHISRYDFILHAWFYSQFIYCPLNIELLCAQICLTAIVISTRNSDFGSSTWFVLCSRHEHETYVRSPAHLVRKQFQEAKPNLGRTYGKKKEPGVEKDRANQTAAGKPEDNLLQQGDSDIQLLQKVS